MNVWVRGYYAHSSIVLEAVFMKIYDELVMDAMLESIRKCTAEGRPFEYKLDSRVIIKK